MTYIEGNVLHDHGFKSDVIVPSIFFLFYFLKKRAQLVEYFSKVRESLKDEGVFFS